MIWCRSWTLLLAGLALLAGGSAQAYDTGEPALAQDLANPVVAIISVPFRNNFDFGGGRTDDGFRYLLEVQPVIPMALSEDWNLITRTILSFAHVERIFPDHRTGLGDTVQTFFLSPSQATTGGLTWGAGPVFLYPTATESGLGARQWGAGPSAVLVQKTGPWLFGMLANQLWGLGGDGPNRPQVNAMLLQPFVTYTTERRLTLVFPR